MCMISVTQVEQRNTMNVSGPLVACKKLPSSCVTSRPNFRPATTNHPPKKFLSMCFLISYAISCSLERLSNAWLMTRLAWYSTSGSISEKSDLTPHFSARSSMLQIKLQPTTITTHEWHIILKMQKRWFPRSNVKGLLDQLSIKDIEST